MKAVGLVPHTCQEHWSSPLLVRLWSGPSYSHLPFDKNASHNIDIITVRRCHLIPACWLWHLATASPDI